MSERVLNLRDFRRPGSRGSRGLVSLPADVVRIDRPRRYSNPYRVGPEPMYGDGRHRWRPTREAAIEAYRRTLVARLVIEPEYLAPLKDKRLACWCAPFPCHGDVIAELAP